MFDSKEPVGSGCVAQVYRGWAKADHVEDPAFQSLIEEMDKEDMLEAWEIPGLRGMASSVLQLWRGSKDDEKIDIEATKEESSTERERLIPVAIKVSLTSKIFSFIPCAFFIN